MTTEPITVAADKPGLARRGRRWLWALVGLLAVAAVAAWVALGVGVWMDIARGPKIILAVIAALSTEALFWTTAAALGVTVFEARRRIWARIRGRA